MKLKIRTTLIAGSIAALLAGPTWAASDTPKESTYTPPSTAEMAQPERDQPAAAQPMSGTPRMGADGGAKAGTAPGDSLYTRSADDLKGVDVVDSTGKDIGEIKQIVLARDQKGAHAVISVGGVLGMGAHDVRVSLDKLRPMDDKLQISATREEIGALQDDTRDADQFVELKGAAPISESIIEFSAFEQGTERKDGKEAINPGASPMTPKSDDPGAAPMTPESGFGHPATTPETPRAPQ